jgi:HD-GYP domain-containing protein (c-di-GMP phosphodiesterase class II)
MMDVHDLPTADHGKDVADLATRVGAVLGLHRAALDELELAARFHDIGKVAVPTEILRKRGPLDEREWRVMERHVEWGADLLMHLPGCETLARIVRHHHERYDGAGYPDGLKGAEIPLAGRIVAACDAYGAMRSDRPYRAALAEARAVAELEEGSGRQFDPAVVEALVYVTATDDGLDAEVAAG